MRRRGLFALIVLTVLIVLRRHLTIHTGKARQPDVDINRYQPAFHPVLTTPVPRPTEPKITFGLFFAGVFTECVRPPLSCACLASSFSPADA
jgi:hypothetical protein